MRHPLSIGAVFFSVALAGCADEVPPAQAPSMATAPLAPPGAEALLARLTADQAQIREAAVAVVATGDAATRRAAGVRLVAVARTVTSAAWRASARAFLERANAQASPAPTPEQLEAQVDRYRDERLVQVLAAMDVVSGPEVVAYGFELAEDEYAPLEVRKAALLLLARHVSDAAGRERGGALWARLFPGGAAAPSAAAIVPPSPSPADPHEEPPPGPPSRLDRWEIEAILSGSAYTISAAGSPSSAGSIGGNEADGRVTLTRFVQPVVDDDAPRSLQPFLQRASTVYATFNAGGFVTRNPSGGQDRTDANFGILGGFDVYVTPSVALFGSFFYGYDVLHDIGVDDTSHLFSPTGGIGFRVKDLRFDFSYTFSAVDTNGTFTPLRWGNAQATAHMVFARKVSVDPWVRAVQSGALGGASVEGFPTKNLGIYGGLVGGQGKLYISDDLVTRVGGDFGIAYWVIPRLRLQAEYDVTANHIPARAFPQPDQNQLEQTLQLIAVTRLP